MYEVTTMTDILFWNVDTQYDFMRETYTDLEQMDQKEGKLPVPGAKDIESNLSALTNHAYQEDIHVMNTADWHNAETDEISDDPDFNQTFPEHCMQETPGARYVPVTRPDPDDTYRINWQDDAVDTATLADNRNTVLYKDKFDVFTGNPHTDTVLAELDPDEVVVYGVATDVCVDYAVNGLLDRGYDVTVVEDATAGLSDADELQQVMEGWEDRGADRTTTRKVVFGADHPFAGDGHEDRYLLYVDVLSHPQGAPTMDELRYANPSMDDDTVQERLDELAQEYNMLERGELPETPVIDGQERSPAFYYTTDAAWEEYGEFIGGANPDGVVGIFRALWDHMEKPDWVIELGQIPRDEVNSSE